ncbi:MAG: YebC/PmpR family DNA-binding transcriptional regulator [Verrucomicrobiales bacterium]|nr:YebC/PmpR family DNA-binding transcriptional regulator [Verrucomicrobiales bacterium]
MAGHNKWSKVKHIKAVVDAKRGKAFSKCSKEITIAAKLGGANPDMNPRLRSAINAAKAANMPNDNIDRAIKKGTGELEGAVPEEILYEAYGPGGIGFLVEVVTDNRNRSAADLRSLLNKNNGTFADAGSVSYQFQRRGEIRLPADAALSEDRATELALESGAEDVQHDGESWLLFTATDQLFEVGNALRDLGHEPAGQALIYQAANIVEIADPEQARQVIQLHEILDDYDDTQNVYSNFDISDEIAASLS